jgi:predicted  nucleic acid-binding Zn-ribbon protein
MTLDELPEQCDAWVERVRGVFHQEIGRARATVKALNSEKAAAQTAIAELRDQHKQAQSQLDAVNNELGQALTLAGLNREKAAAHKALEALKVEMAEAQKALEALNKQRSDAKRQVVAAQDDMQSLRAERAEATAEIARVKSLFGVAR